MSAYQSIYSLKISQGKLKQTEEMKLLPSGYYQYVPSSEHLAHYPCLFSQVVEVRFRRELYVPGIEKRQSNYAGYIADELILLRPLPDNPRLFNRVYV